MTTSRLLSQIVISSNGAFQVWIDTGGAGTTGTATVPDGTYYWSCDGTADDLALALVTAMTAVNNNGWTVDVIGVDVTSSTYCEGRIAIVGGAAWTINWTDATVNKIDPRILGSRGLADEGAAGAVWYYSDDVHRYGWYPQDTPEEDLPTQKADVSVSMTTGRVTDTIDDGEYQTIGLMWARVPAVFMRIAGSDTARATPSLVTVGDLNCGWERFCLDVSRNDLRWRYYAVTATKTTYLGPYALALRPQASGDPAVGCALQERAGELWRISTEGMVVT